MTLNYQVVVVGGGPAGLAAACSAREAGAERCWFWNGTRNRAAF